MLASPLSRLLLLAPVRAHRSDQRPESREEHDPHHSPAAGVARPGRGAVATVMTHLNERGTTRRQGMIVDANYAAASSTKTKAGKRDPEMHQIKEGNRWCYGM